MSQLMKVVTVEFDNALQVTWPNGETSEFSFLWLRDNARDPESFDSRSHQREVFTAKIDPDIKPQRIELSDAGEAILVWWHEGESEISYPAEFLYRYRAPVNHTSAFPKQVYWDAEYDIAPLQYSNLINEGQTQPLLSQLATHGFALVQGCPCESDSVNQLASLLGYIRTTIFGGLWTFEADETMADSAYTSHDLRPHTDGSYSLDAPGVQILLCIDQEATGGDSIMIDGFNVADEIRRTAPSVFKSLCEIDVEGLYQGDGVKLLASRPVIRLNKAGEFEQITFNNYDRNTMSLPKDEMARLYEAIQLIDNQFNSPARQWRHQLKAGEALVFDNWRLLHGRTAYSGKRKISGCYINREDLVSQYYAHFDGSDLG